MRFLSALKLGSLVAAVCLGAASAGMVGCDGGHDHFHGGGPGGFAGGPPSGTPDQVTIDTGATLNATAGTGVGVFVQYATGGHWTVFTSCDTNTPTNPDHVACNFDVIVTGLTRDVTLSNPEGQNLSPGDIVEIQQDGSLHLGTTTSTGLDGFTFDAPQGAGIELAIYLDGSAYDSQGNPNARFIYWIGKGVLHDGSPTNPVDITPSAM
jgi:hypothetical protein